jgi:hypothetical protein
MSHLLISASQEGKITGRRQGCKAQMKLLIDGFPYSPINSCILLICGTAMQIKGSFFVNFDDHDTKDKIIIWKYHRACMFLVAHACQLIYSEDKYW